MKAKKHDIKTIDRLQKRSDFLRVQAAAQKWVSKSLILSLAPQKIVPDTGYEGLRPPQAPRFGITVTKRLNKSAVARNRMKRRLRAAVYDVFPHYAAPGYDYVLIARQETATRPYAEIVKDLRWCLRRMGTIQGDSAASGHEKSGPAKSGFAATPDSATPASEAEVPSATTTEVAAPKTAAPAADKAGAIDV